jgi:hypothetical protein
MVVVTILLSVMGKLVIYLQATQNCHPSARCAAWSWLRNKNSIPLGESRSWDRLSGPVQGLQRVSESHCSPLLYSEAAMFPDHSLGINMFREWVVWLDTSDLQCVDCFVMLIFHLKICPGHLSYKLS